MTGACHVTGTDKDDFGLYHAVLAMSRNGDLRLYSGWRKDVMSMDQQKGLEKGKTKAKAKVDKAIDSSDKSDLELVQVYRASHGGGQMCNCMRNFDGTVVTAGSDWQLRLWDVSSVSSVGSDGEGDSENSENSEDEGNERREMDRYGPKLQSRGELSGHSNEICCLGEDFYAAPAADSAVEPPSQLKQSALVQATPRDFFVFSGDIGGNLVMWDFRSFRVAREVEQLHSSAITNIKIYPLPPSSSKSSVNSSSFTTFMPMLYTGGKDGFINVLSLELHPESKYPCLTRMQCIRIADEVPPNLRFKGEKSDRTCEGDKSGGESGTSAVSALCFTEISVTGDTRGTGDAGDTGDTGEIGGTDGFRERDRDRDRDDDRQHVMCVSTVQGIVVLFAADARVAVMTVDKARTRQRQMIEKGVLKRNGNGNDEKEKEKEDDGYMFHSQAGAEYGDSEIENLQTDMWSCVVKERPGELVGLLPFFV